MLIVYLAFYLAFYLTFDLTYIRTVHLGSISAAILNYSDILSGICSGQCVPRVRDELLALAVISDPLVLVTTSRQELAEEVEARRMRKKELHLC